MQSRQRGQDQHIPGRGSHLHRSRRAIDGWTGPRWWRSTIVPLEVPLKRRDFQSVVRAIHGTPSGGTDLAAGFDYAVQHRLAADLVIGITDNRSSGGAIDDRWTARVSRSV